MNLDLIWPTLDDYVSGGLDGPAPRPGYAASSGPVPCGSRVRLARSRSHTLILFIESGCPWRSFKAPEGRMIDFDVVWQRIVALQGETFHQKTGTPSDTPSPAAALCRARQIASCRGRSSPALTSGDPCRAAGSFKTCKVRRTCSRSLLTRALVKPVLRRHHRRPCPALQVASVTRRPRPSLAVRPRPAQRAVWLARPGQWLPGNPHRPGIAITG
jgi:hypothetical protein